ncbi:TIGR04086 family membrane protein [Clostridium sp. MB40-C1]|uniref:TIGR04086 family membrane protein n=1 Tax=Clostridium sp. MB40-C1 TaxID=3070996 RepID=UPI0027E1BE4B|nr:TIGR04086 family membrane protein [Clostridium sp. MB40-C1]WMJ81267.1 TIGR04086 family membrane protein [Clostridium sp. MB40-C1]
MGDNSNIMPIGEGVVRSFFLTLGLLLIYAVITSFIDTNAKFDSVYKVVITALGVMYGTMYAVKKINKRGWLVGLVVALIYMIIIYLVSVLNGRGFALTNFSILRIVLALGVGTLSGMLGVNL